MIRYCVSEVSKACALVQFLIVGPGRTGGLVGCALTLVRNDILRFQPALVLDIRSMGTLLDLEELA